MAKKTTTKKTASPSSTEPAQPDTAAPKPEAQAASGDGVQVAPQPTAEDIKAVEDSLKVDGATVFVSRFRRYRLTLPRQRVLEFDNGRAVVTDPEIVKDAKATPQFGNEFHLA